jgi:uncharacterized protein (TIGR02145 family)
MKKLTLIYLSVFLCLGSMAQVKRVAILDFDNISGISKYDGLGKAMSSMLISDIEANVSPKRLQLVERAQIQKILKEQKFQVSGNVDKNTSVKVGKILGVSYLLIGDVYVLNDDLVVNARLTDAETGDILFSKKQEGKSLGWLKLKTEIAKQLASQFSLPFTDPLIPDQQFAIATLTTFGNAVAATDNGDLKKAEELSTTVKDFSPDFKYVEDLSKEIESLKSKVKEIESEVLSSTENPFNVGLNYIDNNEYASALKYLQFSLGKIPNDENKLGRKAYHFSFIALCQLELNDYSSAIKNVDEALNIYPELMLAKFCKLELLFKSGKILEAKNYTETIIKDWERVSKLNWSDFSSSYPNLFFDDGKLLMNKGFTSLDYDHGNNRANLITHIGEIYSKYQIDKNIMQDHYKELDKEIVLRYPNFSVPLLTDQKSLDLTNEYFKIANSIGWKMIKNKNYYEAKVFYLAKINQLISIIEYNFTHKGPEMKKYFDYQGVHLTFNKNFPFVNIGYYLGNLGMAYMGLNQIDKAKAIYAAFKFYENSDNNFLRIQNFKFLVSNKFQVNQMDDSPKFSTMFEKDLEELHFTNFTKDFQLSNSAYNSSFGEDVFESDSWTISKAYKFERFFYRDNKAKKSISNSFNLKVEKFKNGDSIFCAKTEEQWNEAINNQIPAFCFYNFDSKNSVKFGNIYNYFALVDKRGLAPSGYHIGTYNDWLRIAHYILGKDNKEGKFPDSSRYHEPELNKVFESLGGAYINSNFYDLDTKGYWWISESNEMRYFYIDKNSNEDKIGENTGSESRGFSIRCFED